MGGMLPTCYQRFVATSTVELCICPFQTNVACSQQGKGGLQLQPVLQFQKQTQDLMPCCDSPKVLSLQAALFVSKAISDPGLN